MRAVFSASYLSPVGGDKMMASTSPADIVQSSDNMVELGQVYCDGRCAGCELGLHLAEPHLRPCGPEGRDLDGDG
ncbi:MAG: hypothetical protein A6F71_09050 [Cycloclasticus sp. symbiont of Poecilosclerida sp. M]|nr:MAG: hypothetical protein A6F71_09050 [Cycloclasticus sp. symbiont of Poecilosclerida sp. M]